VLNNEVFSKTVEVIQALVKRVIYKHQQRACFACIQDLPLFEGEHVCLMQSPSDLVELYFEDSYNTINSNLMHAMFMLDGDEPPRLCLDTVKQHCKDDIKMKLSQHMDFVNNGEMIIARAMVYLSPLFKSIS